MRERERLNRREDAYSKLCVGDRSIFGLLYSNLGVSIHSCLFGVSSFVVRLEPLSCRRGSCSAWLANYYGAETLTTLAVWAIGL